jgi:hypothetical protein
MLLALAVRASAVAPVHEFAGIALSPNGEQIASIEVGDPKTAHQRVLIRDRQGQVLEVSDPCGACRYAHPAWSADMTDRLHQGCDEVTGCNEWRFSCSKRFQSLRRSPIQ